MKSVFLLLSLFFLSGCVNDNDNNFSTNIDLLFLLEYKNIKGEDLLNPLTVGGWNKEEISIFSVDEYGYSLPIANEKTEHFVKAIEDWNEKKYCIWFIYSQFINKETKSIVYIVLPNGDTDKIEVWATRGKNSLVKDKLFYNDVLVWDQSHQDNWVTIIK